MSGIEPQPDADGFASAFPSSALIRSCQEPACAIDENSYSLVDELFNEMNQSEFAPEIDAFPYDLEASPSLSTDDEDFSNNDELDSQVNTRIKFFFSLYYQTRLL